MDLGRLLVLLFVVYAAARVGAEVSEWLRQPPVIGEILAGVIVGPALLGWVPAEHEALEAIAELGIVFLLFSVGLETDLGELRRVGGIATGVAVGGVVVPFVLGVGFMGVLGYSTGEFLFVGTAMVATSVGVTARVLRDKGKLATRESRIVLGAAVVDDVLALLMLAVVSAVTVAGGFSPSETILLLLEVVGFLLILGIFGRRILRRVFPALRRLKVTEPVLGFAIVAALGLAAASAILGLAAIVGAFLAGTLFAEAGGEHDLERKVSPLVTFFVPFFFVHVGTLVELDSFKSGEGMLLIAGVTVLAVLGKLIGSGAVALKMGKRSAAIIGFGMVPRGEVGIIVASLGLASGVIGQSLYGVVVVMSLLTTLIAPPVLAKLFEEPSDPAPLSS